MPPGARRQGAARLLRPSRSQIELRASDLESLLGEDHLARLVWGYVERQDLSRLVEAIKARGSNAGRSAIDPRILFALWLYAVLSGVGSGREVARLTREHDTYRWICGGVSVNHHGLNDFRSGNEALMDEVLTTNVAALAAAGAISLDTTCQDQVIVGVAVTNAGSDMAQMAPMVEQVILRSGSTPAQWLVDGGFPAHEQIDAVHERTRGKTEVLAPVPEPKAKKGSQGDEVPPADKQQPKDDDSAPVAQWRSRMACQDIKDAHGKDRAAVDRSGHRCVLDGRSGRVGSARGEKSPRIGTRKTPERPRWRSTCRRFASLRLHRHANRSRCGWRRKPNASRSLTSRWSGWTFTARVPSQPGRPPRAGPRADGSRA